MNIIKQDKEKVYLRITDLDDLWYLRTIIEPGDFVKSKTTRKIKIGEGENAKLVKKTLTLMIEAETVDFGASGDSLRINGKIKEGPEDIAKDSYHAISLTEGSECSIEKVNWLSYQKQKLQEAAEKKYNYLICLFDREEVIFALTKKYGYEVLARIKGDVPKKSKTVEVRGDFKNEIIKNLETYDARYKPENIILASPAFYKDVLLKKLTGDLKKKVVLAICSDVNEAALDEVIKRPELAKTLKNSRAREEQLLVDELLSEINKNNLAEYGEEKVNMAVASGAVSKLLITDNFIKKKREEGDYERVDKMLRSVDNLQGSIHIISSEHEAGKKINGLGGIAVMLRYKLEW